VEDKTHLTADQVDEELTSLVGWTREGTLIQRHVELANFKDITAFLQHLVGTIAAQNHHPDFSLDTGTRTVAVSVTTHSAGGITRADIDFATALNAWAPGGRTP
jgi:4a-hydroxytetrahydrobiopterin dehydratase